ncbi:MAG: hypothetical protein M1829_005806 [Trizodia sp. TS-e1964]|nr:MAG: hypothetical protein M1829_005806 [Trizodia sp. TS-e1964]
MPSYAAVPPQVNFYTGPPTLLRSLVRKEKYIQKDLQILLDAQADSLTSGVPGMDGGEASSDSSRTPTTSTTKIRSHITIPVRQPLRRKLGLRGARIGILEAMRELAAVKSEQGILLEEELGKGEEILKRVEKWEGKRQGLETAIQTIEEGREGAAVARMKLEADAVESEIHGLETRLNELKAKHLHMKSKISEKENAVQSNISSYKASLTIVESEVRQFLAKPPQPSDTTPRNLSNSAFMTLPPKRRTLEMAKDYWITEYENLQRRHEDIEIEREALQEGAVVWHDVIKEVSAFEKQLRTEMNHIEPPGSLEPCPTLGLQETLRSMEATITSMQSKLKLAETNNWNLLVCCIGAELEAFQQGILILNSALGTYQNEVGQASAEAFEAPPAPRPLDLNLGLEELVLKTTRTTDRSESEDDDPDPDFLISRG